jgi:hypothetical protein
MELDLPYLPLFLPERRDRARAALLRIRASQLKGADFGPTVDTICDLVAREFERTGALTRQTADRVVSATLDLVVQLGVKEPPRCRLDRRDSVKIRGRKFPRTEIEEVRVQLKRRVQARIDLAIQQRSAERLEREADGLDSPTDRAAVSEQTRLMPAREVDRPAPPTDVAALPRVTQSAWVKKQRQLSGWSVGELASKSGLDRKTVKAADEGRYVNDKSWHLIVETFSEDPVHRRKIDMETVQRTENSRRKAPLRKPMPKPPKTS